MKSCQAIPVVALTEILKHWNHPRIQALPMLIPTYWQIDSYPLLQGSLWAMERCQSETHRCTIYVNSNQTFQGKKTNADAPKESKRSILNLSQLEAFVFQSCAENCESIGYT